MSDLDQASGKCAAFGCPLLGSIGAGDGRWVCCCHANRQTGHNDAITNRLKTEWLDVVDMTIAIRRDETGTGRSRGMAAAHRAMKAAGRTDLIYRKDTDGNLKAYLLRIERALIDAVSDIGKQARIALTVPTAPVAGPTHALAHYSAPEQHDEEHDA